MTGGASASYLKEPAPDYDPSPRIRAQSAALEISRLISDRAADPLRSSEKVATEIALVLKRPDALCAQEPSSIALDQLHSAAEITMASLPPAQTRALWIERRWLACTPRSTHVRDRLDVYAAVAARDPKAMLTRARALLDAPSRGGDNWGRYLLGTAMLGAVAAGEHGEALEMWKRYGGALYPSVAMPHHVVYLLNLRQSPGRLNP
jgi:hypothetical protein